MRQGGSWIIEIHNDHINTLSGLKLVFEEVIGMPADLGHRMVEDMVEDGHAELTPVSLPEAERLVAAFQVHGLIAKLRKARHA